MLYQETIENRIAWLKGKIAELTARLDTLEAGIDWGNTWRELDCYRKELAFKERLLLGKVSNSKL